MISAVAQLPTRENVCVIPCAKPHWPIGVHTDMMGGWIVNGSPLGMVHLTIEPPAAGRFASLPIRVSNLWLSLEEPDAFVEAVAAASPGAS